MYDPKGGLRLEYTVKWRTRALVFSVVFGLGFSAEGAGFPERNLRFIVPFAPGGGTDFFARTLSSRLSEILGQQVIVDNRAGAQGNIGSALGADAKPDGYTITLGHMSVLALNPHVYSNLGFDPLRDITGVARCSAEPWVMLVPPSLPVKSAKELVALAKQRPGKVSFAATNTTGQILGELFKIENGIDMFYVPYKGTTPAFVDLMAGRVDMYISGPVGAVPHVKAEKLRAIMVVGPNPHAMFPNVPSAPEAGVPQLALTGWYGVTVPAATPRSVISRLNAGILLALNQPEVRARLSTGGIDVAPSTPEEFQQLMRNDHKRWGDIIKNIRASGVDLR